LQLGGRVDDDGDMENVQVKKPAESDDEVGNPIHDDRDENGVEHVDKLIEMGRNLDNIRKKKEEEDECLAAKKIQKAWRLAKDESDDIEHLNGNASRVGYEPFPYEGVNYQIERGTERILNMEGELVGALESGIVVFESPFDEVHDGMATEDVSESSGDETDDMSDDE